MMKRMLIDGYTPLIGPRIAINDFHLGPLYYYLLSLYYTVTNLDPIAAAYFSVTGYVVGTLSLFFVARKLFGLLSALIALALYTTSYFQMMSDKPGWNVSLIIPVTAWILYALWKVWKGENTWWVVVGILTGLMFHVHITIVLLFPTMVYVVSRAYKTNKTYILGGILCVFLSMISVIVYEFQKGFTNSMSLEAFIASDVHIPTFGYTVSRFPDMFFMFESLLYFPLLSILAYLLPVMFWRLTRNDSPDSSYAYLSTTSKLVLTSVWVSLIFYANTVFEYYFIITGPYIYLMLAVLIARLITNSSEGVRVISGIGFFVLIGIQIYAVFTRGPIEGLADEKQRVRDTIDRGEQIEFNEGEIQSYLYWYYVEKSQ